MTEIAWRYRAGFTIKSFPPALACRSRTTQGRRSCKGRRHLAAHPLQGVGRGASARDHIRSFSSCRECYLLDSSKDRWSMKCATATRTASRSVAGEERTGARSAQGRRPEHSYRETGSRASGAQEGVVARVERRRPPPLQSLRI